MQYTIDQVKEKIKDRPYKMIESSFTMLKNGFDAITNDGYYVRMNGDNVIGGRDPEIFSKFNPYTLKNIQHYMDLRGTGTKVIDTKYTGNTNAIKMICGRCHKKFEKKWVDIQISGSYCHECGIEMRGIKGRLDINIVKDKLNSIGLHLLNDTMYIPTDEKIDCYDDNGYKYQCWFGSLEKSFHPNKFGTCNKYTIDNINLFMQKNSQDDYYVTDELPYLGNNKPLMIRHKVCGNTFKSDLLNIEGIKNKNAKRIYRKQCPYCYPTLIESVHAYSLKQVFMHEYPDTTLEDRSCINPETGRSLPTDIVNHRLKIAVEIQSHYHDAPEKVIRDAFKKDFWISKGYDFYDPDIRNYTIVEMIQIFFPDITEIPEYIDLTKVNDLDFAEIQKYLDDGLSLKDIAAKIGCEVNKLHSLCRHNKIKLPSNYMEKYNIRPIVMLDKEGNYLRRFKNKGDADRAGYKYGTITRALNKKQKYSYDSIWLYEDEYLAGDYTIPEYTDKYDIKVDYFDDDGVKIKTFENIYDASKELNIRRYEIYDSMMESRKIKGHYFKISA